MNNGYINRTICAAAVDLLLAPRSKRLILSSPLIPDSAHIETKKGGTVHWEQVSWPTNEFLVIIRSPCSYNHNVSLRVLYVELWTWLSLGQKSNESNDSDTPKWRWRGLCVAATQRQRGYGMRGQRETGRREERVCCVILIQSSITPGFAGAAQPVDIRLSESGWMTLYTALRISAESSAASG